MADSVLLMLKSSPSQKRVGKALFCSPFLSSIGLAANALLLARNDAQKAAWLPGLAAAEKTATLAWSEKNATQRPEFKLTGTGATLSGSCRYILDGHTSDFLIIAAQSEKGTGLFLIDGNADGMTRTWLPTMDTTRKMAQLEFDDVPVTADNILGAAGESDAVLADVLDLGRVILAAEQVGVAQACLDMSVEYAKVREQFGKPIGSFQALKHKCADMMVAVESARSAAYFAGWAAANDPESMHEAVLTAQAFASETCFKCASDAIQILGGIGFTWEHDAHLYLKRAKASEELLGSPSFHIDQFAIDVLGI